MSVAAKIHTEANGLARVSGDLTFKTVKALLLESDKLVGPGSQVSQLDLAEVANVDSSGLALLLEWQSSARKQGRELGIIHAPSDLERLARLCEAQDLLRLTSRLNPV